MKLVSAIINKKNIKNDDCPKAVAVRKAAPRTILEKTRFTGRRLGVVQDEDDADINEQLQFGGKSVLVKHRRAVSRKISVTWSTDT